jgi:putative Holliday junction resolvase
MQFKQNLLVENMSLGLKIGVDFGTQRIGLASSDSSGIVITPIGAYALDKALGKLLEISRENPISVIYLGLPKHLAGLEGQSAISARQFAGEIKALNIAPVYLVDERLTTTSASQKKELVEKFGIDAIAAQEILEFALNGERLSGGFFGESI